MFVLVVIYTKYSRVDIFIQKIYKLQIYYLELWASSSFIKLLLFQILISKSRFSTMLKLVGKKESKREDEENKGEEVKKKTSPAEIRWRKEIPDLDLPDHASVDFPDEADIMNFNVTVDLKKEEWLWKGGKYVFSINIPKTYPHKPPKVHWDTQIYIG